MGSVLAVLEGRFTQHGLESGLQLWDELLKYQSQA